MHPTHAARRRAVIDRTPLIGADKNAGEAPAGEAAGDIEFRNVDFTYAIRPDVPIFVNFSLRIAPGKVTALVGESGSGKSTVVGLIERFYDIDGGNIYIDGVDIRQLSVAYLRSKARAPQPRVPVLFTQLPCAHSRRPTL